MLPALIQAHGMLLTPAVRTMPAMDNKDYLRNPLPRTFNGASQASMYTCGGIDKPAKPAYTMVTPGQVLPLTWEMGLWTGAALHQGLVEVSLSQNADKGPWTQIGLLSLVGDSTVASTPHGMSVTLPKTLECAAVGGCTLQWRWNASVTPERFVNCADLMTGTTSVAGSSSVGSTASNAKPVATVSNANKVATPSTTSVAVVAQPSPTAEIPTGGYGRCSRKRRAN